MEQDSALSAGLERRTQEQELRSGWLNEKRAGTKTPALFLLSERPALLTGASGRSLPLHQQQDDLFPCQPVRQQLLLLL